MSNEKFGDIGQRFTEGHRNGRLFEVAGCETGSTNNILRGLKHCAFKRETEIAVIVLPKTELDKETFDMAIVDGGGKAVEKDSPTEWQGYRRKLYSADLSTQSPYAFYSVRTRTGVEVIIDNPRRRKLY